MFCLSSISVKRLMINCFCLNRCKRNKRNKSGLFLGFLGFAGTELYERNLRLLVSFLEDASIELQNMDKVMYIAFC